MEKKVVFCESKMAVVDRVLAEKAKEMNKEIRTIRKENAGLKSSTKVSIIKEKYYKGKATDFKMRTTMLED